MPSRAIRLQNDLTAGEPGHEKLERIHMLRIRRFLILPAAALFLAACGSGVNVTSDWSPEIDFSSFESFGWLPDARSDGAGPASDPFTDQRIRAAIEEQFAERGLQKVSGEGDLMVGYQVTTRTNVSYRTTGTTWGRAGWGGWGGVTTMRTVPVYSQSGTLLISIYQTEGKSLVWHGSGQADLRNITDPELRQERISDVVNRVLRTFPPEN